jgi:hypothetical protein
MAGRDPFWNVQRIQLVPLVFLEARSLVALVMLDYY